MGGSILRRHCPGSKRRDSREGLGSPCFRRYVEVGKANGDLSNDPVSGWD